MEEEDHRDALAVLSRSPLVAEQHNSQRLGAGRLEERSRPLWSGWGGDWS